MRFFRRASPIVTLGLSAAMFAATSAPAQVQIGDLLAQNLAAFNLLGRLSILQHAEGRVAQPLRLATHSSLQQFAASVDDATMRVDFTLPSIGAIDYLRNLTPVTRTVFDELTRQYRNDAITVAGVNDQRIIAKVQAELGAVLESGGTSADFRAAVNTITDAAGIDRIAAFELDTVFTTNVQKAYGAGRYEQMTEESTQDALPFWQYWTVGDDRVRMEHAAIDQFIAQAIDPVWQKIYPPCGFNCRCSVVPLLRDEALDMDPKAMDDGYMRLPLLAKMKVPQPGFKNIFGA